LIKFTVLSDHAYTVVSRRAHLNVSRTTLKLLQAHVKSVQKVPYTHLILYSTKDAIHNNPLMSCWTIIHVVDMLLRNKTAEYRKSLQTINLNLCAHVKKIGFHISPFAHDIDERNTHQPSKFHCGASF
jgi:hypothetical protein